MIRPILAAGLLKLHEVDPEGCWKSCFAQPFNFVFFRNEVGMSCMTEQKDNGCRCTVKCYSLCEPKIQASGEGDEIEWELLSDPRGRWCFVG